MAPIWGVQQQVASRRLLCCSVFTAPVEAAMKLISFLNQEGTYTKCDCCF